MAIDPQFNERYQRQILLPGFGRQGQQKLQNARVLVLGAGGLGCPALQYLAAAGVGTIGIIDFDTVSISNLHRQLLFTTEDVGKPKVDCARNSLLKLNPLVHIETYPFRLTNQNALELMASYDMILDGTDNFATRYLVADATEILEKPLIYGAVSRFEGQVAVFNASDGQGNTTTYRDLFPVPPHENEIPNCAEGGVLGVLPGIIGTLQAAEVMKMITGLGQPLTNQMMIYQALYNQFYTIAIQPDLQRKPVSTEQFLRTDYIRLCASTTTDDIEEIAAEDLFRLRTEKRIKLIDVRERGEMPEIEWEEMVQIPLSELRQQQRLTVPEDIIITVCQSGKRSRIAAEKLKEIFRNNKQIFSLRGGVSELLS